ncbi:hypothetical protein A2307_01715 [Candidatus Peregrinibacteria bacterium RIFOXYB2_FULL_33_20]|nr:MAG: hypothetical protein A2263_00070 [Candidatus Peregrinibacteria bacterium RIFOXYA2_FULL_33_21]OGJ50262.1 MAG: hypothetical protein A2307_01715 [Candidatus Peregrinibacteria bacterium RIFOXYB2_FULL_33_20]
MKSRGLSFAEIGMTQGIYYFAFLLFELPTGVLADKLGRKTAITLASIIKILALLTSLISHSLIIFIIAEFFYSLSRALASGATTALLYDSLLNLKEEVKFKSIQGKSYGMHLLGNTLGGSIGALITYLSDVEYVYVLSIFMAIICTIIAILFKEPILNLEAKTEGIKHVEKNLSAYFQHTICSFQDIIKSKYIVWIILYSALMFNLIRSNLISLQQPFLMFLMLPKFMFGIIDTVVSLGSVIFASIAHKIEKILTFKYLIILIVFTQFISFLGMGSLNSKLALGFLFIQMVAVGIYIPITRDYINFHIPNSEKRATILSFDSLISRGSFAVLSIIIGYVLDKFGVQSAMLMISFLALMFGTVVLSVRPKDKLIPPYPITN